MYVKSPKVFLQLELPQKIKILGMSIQFFKELLSFCSFFFFKNLYSIRYCQVYFNPMAYVRLLKEQIVCVKFCFPYKSSILMLLIILSNENIHAYLWFHDISSTRSAKINQGPYQVSKFLDFSEFLLFLRNSFSL